MGVNRFNQPREAQHEQPYVSQYVAMPFEQYAKNIQGDQANWDFAEKTHGEILGAGIDSIDYEADAKNALLNGYVSKAHEMVEEHGGDYGELSSKIGVLKSQLKTSLEKGRLGQFEQNLKKREDYVKSVRENTNLDADAKEYMIKQSDFEFKQEGRGSMNGEDFDGKPLYNSTIPDSKALEYADKIKAQTIEQYGNIGLKATADGGGITVLGRDGTNKTVLTQEEIAKDVYNQLLSNHEVMASINRKVNDMRHMYNGDPKHWGAIAKNEVTKRLLAIANATGDTYEQSEQKEIHDDHYLKTGNGSGSGKGGLNNGLPQVDVAGGEETKNNTLIPFYERNKGALAGYGNQLKQSLVNEISEKYGSTKDANRMSIAITRNILGIPGNVALTDKDYDKATELIAKGKIANLGANLNEDQVKSLQLNAMRLVAENKTAKFHEERYKDRAIQYLSKSEKDILNSKEPVFQVNAGESGHERTVRYKKYLKEKDNYTSTHEKLKDKIEQLDKDDNELRGTVQDKMVDKIGGITKVGADGVVYKDNAVDLHKVLSQPNIGAHVLSIISIDPSTGKSESVLNILAPKDFAILDATKQQSVKSQILNSAMMSETENDDGTYNTVFTYNGKKATVPASLGSSAVKPNSIGIRVDPGEDFRLNGKINNIIKKATIHGEIVLPGTDLILKHMQDGSLDILNKQTHSVYGIERSHVTQLLTDYAKAQSSKDPITEFKKLETKFKQTQGL